MRAMSKFLRPRGKRRHNRLRPCFARARGNAPRLVVVRITVKGSTGRASKVVVRGPFAKTRAGRCMARYLRAKLRFPKFSRPQVQFLFPIVTRK